LSRISFAGLRETVIDTQKIFLDAAVQQMFKDLFQAIIQPILQT
jgi:hypothetical protein